MRLIDADKLISEQDVYFDGNRTVKDIIDEQPTVRQWIPVSERLAFSAAVNVHLLQSFYLPGQ